MDILADDDARIRCSDGHDITGITSIEELFTLLRAHVNLHRGHSPGWWSHIPRTLIPRTLDGGADAVRPRA